MQWEARDGEAVRAWGLTGAERFEMDCKEIVIEWLKQHGADGLCEPDTECGCGLEDFAPCGDGPYPHCKPAKAATLGDGDYVGDAGPGDTAYFVMPNAELTGRASAACDGPR